MSLQKLTRLGRIEIEDGRIIARLEKIVADGDTVYAAEPHRAVIESGRDVMEAFVLVNAQLADAGFPPLAEDAIARIAAHAALAQ